MEAPSLDYCAFHKHANSKVQKPPSQLRFSLPSIIITITSNEPWNSEAHKTDRNPLNRNHNPWPFEPVKIKFCFLRGPLRWLTAAKNAIVSWLLNFRIRMFVKSAVKSVCALHLVQCQVQSKDSDNEVEIKKKKRYGSLNGLGVSMDGPEIPLFVHCGHMFTEGM